MLSAPVTSKECGDGIEPAKGLAWGYSCMQGWRVGMEDAHLALGGLEGDWEETALFGVMDGHGGQHVALFCQKYLPSAISSGPVKDPETALTSAFHHMDELLSDPEYLGELQSLSSSSMSPIS